MFRVRMEFNLDGKDLDLVRRMTGRSNLTADDVKSFMEREYIKEAADGAERQMVIQVEEVSHGA